MDISSLRRVLLELVGTARFPDTSGLNASDWTRLDYMAAQHRLQPLLHDQHRGNNAIPLAIASNWRAAHRTAAMTALAQTADLHATVRLLEVAGYAPIALKGSWLARCAYPEAAQRPARDIDLLLDPGSVLGAFELLQAHGFPLEYPPEMALADILRLDKHMPPLRAPNGTTIELHQHLWEHDGRLDHASPAARDAELRQRALRADDGILYPSGDDMLAHLIVHAAYSHRLDCGPLLLADIDFLLRRISVNWHRFWEVTAQQGWQRGARLVLELVAQYRTGTTIDFTADQGPAPLSGLMEAAPDLLLQDLDTRRSAGFAASAAMYGGPRLLARLTGKRSSKEGAAAVRNMAEEGGFLGWASSRLVRTVTELARADVRRQSRSLSQISKWLDQ
jgi:hypothetical protein